MTKTLVTREFRSADRNPNVNGDQRVLHVTETDGQVRIVVSGAQGVEGRLLAISDVVVPLIIWEQHQAAILAAAGGAQ